VFKYVQLYHQKFFGASVCWLVFCVSGLTLDLEQRKTRSTSHASKLVKRPTSVSDSFSTMLSYSVQQRGFQRGRDLQDSPAEVLSRDPCHVLIAYVGLRWPKYNASGGSSHDSTGTLGA